jgi:hypothetical protein
VELLGQEWAVHVPNVLFFKKKIQVFGSRITEEDLKYVWMVKMSNLIWNLCGIRMW